MKSKRNSNIEFLRLLLMFLIVQGHFLIIASGNAPFISQNFEFITYAGKLGVDVFIIITCYYMVGKKFSLNRIISILKPTIFYSMLLLIFWLILPLDKSELVNWITNPLKMYWFVTAYLALVLIIPLMNVVLDKMNHDQIAFLKWGLFACTSLIPTILGLNLGFLRLSVFIFFFVYMYDYRVYNKKEEKIKPKIIQLITTISIFAFIYSVSNYYQLNFSIFTTIPQLLIENNLFQVITAILLFKVFLIKEPINNEIINQLSKSAFPIYLIHEHEFVRTIRANLLSEFHIDNFFLLVLTNIVWTVFLFSLFLFTDQLIRKITSSVKKGL